jgi:membrane protease YdiL (CAAX protease family)
MTIRLLAFCFLFINCVCWPLRSFLALRKHPIGQPIATPKGKRYISGIGFTLFQAVLALWTAYDSRLPVFGSLRIDLPGILVTIAFLAITLGTLPWLVQHRSPGWRMRFYSILPTTSGERAVWWFICILAAVAEEIVYRGVAFGLFYRLTGSFWAAAILAAVVFASHHLVQGWISAGTIFIVGLGFQLLVQITGGLYAAIAAHFVYDLVAGLVFGRAAQKELGRTGNAPLNAT